MGTLLEFLGMRQVYIKGIELANKHVLMACTAYNLKKLMRFSGADSVVQYMKNAGRKLKQTAYICHLYVTTIVFYQKRILLTFDDLEEK